LKFDKPIVSWCIAKTYRLVILNHRVSALVPPQTAEVAEVYFGVNYIANAT